MNNSPMKSIKASTQQRVGLGAFRWLLFCSYIQRNSISVSISERGCGKSDPLEIGQRSQDERNEDKDLERGAGAIYPKRGVLQFFGVL